MADHDESLIDKAKRALGMGDDDDRHETAGTADTGERGTYDDLDADRGEGWAGVPDAAGVGTSEHSVGGARDDEMGLHTARSGAEADAPFRDTTEDQFAGSGYDTSYGAGTDARREDALGSGEPEMGIGLDREATSGTGEHNTGTGLDYDFEERSVTEESPGGAAGTDEDGPWTRGEAASGQSPLVSGEDTTVDRERRESGL